MGAPSQSGTGLLEDTALPDRYRVVRRVARGGMGSVWRADDLLLGREVAIKLLGEQFVDDEQAVRRFQREARTAARVSGHPNVVTIYDVGQTSPPGRPFIVMEYLAGGTVGDAIRRGAVPREQALRWLEEVASALDFANEHGVIHRDIKPGNLLLDRARTLHVADFGIARVGAEQTLTATGQLMGTAAYISPEQALGRPATDASDRYALAVVAFELLAGERPFISGQFTSQARQHVELEPPPISHRNPALPAALDPVLSRGMAKDPRERFPTAVAFTDAIRTALIADPSARRAGAAAPLRRTQPARAPTTRHPRAIAVAGLATAAFGVGAALGASSDGGSPVKQRTVAARPARAANRPRTLSPQHPHHHHAAPPTRPHPAPPPPPPPTTTATDAAATTTPPTAETLEARGHELMANGEYSQAIAVLHEAVGAASPGSLTHAYALYDLGRSLRLSGDPQAAVPVLERRLHARNQTGIVRHELGLALKASGTGAARSGGAPISAPVKHNHKPDRRQHHPRGHDGGD